MKYLKTLLAGVSLAASTAAMATVAISGSGLQTAVNGLYSGTGASPVSAAQNVNTDQAAEVGTFVIEAAGGSFNTMIVETAGLADVNTFGIYDPFSGAKLELFSGSATAKSRALIDATVNTGGGIDFTLNVVGPTITFSSQVFGYYLNNGTNTFYSQKVRNANQDDHLVLIKGDGDYINVPPAPTSFWGSQSFVFGWEDLAGLGDRDYDDMVIYVTNIRAVPEPASLALLGLGLAGLAAAARRKQGKD